MLYICIILNINTRPCLMKKTNLFNISFINLLILPFSLHSQEQQRKKVGVVLSGGGAKGMATSKH